MKIVFLLLISIACLGQAKNDSIISIPSTLEARMIEAEKIMLKAKEDQAKAEKELQDGIKILFEIVGKKPEEYDVIGYAPGILKIKRKKNGSK